MLDIHCSKYALISEYTRVLNILGSEYVRVTQGFE